MTREEALVAATMLLDCYPRQVSSGMLEAYAVHLADLERDSTLAAVNRLIRTSKWLPTIAEIRKAERAIRVPETPIVDEGWAQAVASLSNGSSPALLTVGDVLVARAVYLLGRREDIAHEPLHFLRPRFYAIYERLVEEYETSVAAGEAPHWLPRSLLAGPRRDPQQLLDGLGER